MKTKGKLIYKHFENSKLIEQYKCIYTRMNSNEINYSDNARNKVQVKYIGDIVCIKKQGFISYAIKHEVGKEVKFDVEIVVEGKIFKEKVKLKTTSIIEGNNTISISYLIDGKENEMVFKMEE